MIGGSKIRLWQKCHGKKGKGQLLEGKHHLAYRSLPFDLPTIKKWLVGFDWG